jgi:hypothetical protein
MQLTCSIVKAHILGADRVYVPAGKSYSGEGRSSCDLANTCCRQIGRKGAWYSTIKALSGANKDYVAYLIGDLGVLYCPSLQARLESLKG